MLVLCGLIAFSAFVAIMQWLDEGWAWKLRLPLLNVPTTASEFGDVAVMTENTTLVAGLFGSAFYCSYYMVIGISLLLPLMLETRWRFIVFIPLMLIAINLVITQERSALVSAGLCIIAFCVTLLRNIKGRTFGVLLLAAMVGMGAAFSARWIVRASTSARYSLWRDGNFSSETRMTAIRDAA